MRTCLKSLYNDRRGQGSIEALFVIPLLLVIFIMIFDLAYMFYDWLVISYDASTKAVAAATNGQFSENIRLQLAQELQSMTVDGNTLTYSYLGSTPPATYDDNTVYIWGTDKDTQVQKGDYIHVYVSYPWKGNFLLIDALGSLITDTKKIRLKVGFAFPSEVYFEEK